MTDHDKALTETIERFEDMARGREKLGARDLLALAHALVDTRRELQRLTSPSPFMAKREPLACPLAGQPGHECLEQLGVRGCVRAERDALYDARDAADRICSCKRSDALRMALTKAIRGYTYWVYRSAVERDHKPDAAALADVDELRKVLDGS